MAKKPAKKTTKPKGPTRSDLIAEALDYKRQGGSYEDIAAQMKVSVDEAENLVLQGLAQIRRETVQDRILLDIERVNQMMTSLYSNAIGGDANAISQVTSLMDRRNKLEELLAPPETPFSYAIQELRKKTGRKPHKPTQKTIGMVEAYAYDGIPHDKIAQRIGISLPTLLLHYADVLDNPRENLRAEAEGILFKWVRKEDRQMTQFFLKTQCGYSEFQRPANPGNGGGESSDGETITIKGGLPDPDPPVSPDPQSTLAP